MTGLWANILKLWIGRFIDITISFKTSLRTLSFVKNWCLYKISLVHLLFPKVIYILIHILSVFWPNITFLGAFEGVFKGLQKTGLNRSRPVNVNRFFCGLYISKRPDRRSGLLRSWSGLVTVFFRSRDRTSKHYWTCLSLNINQSLKQSLNMKRDFPLGGSWVLKNRIRKVSLGFHNFHSSDLNGLVVPYRDVLHSTAIQVFAVWPLGPK